MISVPDDAFSGKSSRWSLRLIGELRLEGPNGETVVLSGRRERVLLAYLALVPDLKESRRNLIGLLWGDRADNTILDNLRTCLWSLRKSLGDQDHPLVLSEREWIRLNSELLEVDVWRFNELVKTGGIDCLGQAVEICSGELLEGLDLESEEFSEWIRDERSRFSDLLLDALSKLMRAHEEAGDKDSALAVGQKILRNDPFNEVALRAMMGLYAASGRRNMALQAYRSFADNLQNELSVEPEAETQDVLRALSEAAPASSNGAESRDRMPPPVVASAAEPAASPSQAPPPRGEDVQPIPEAIVRETAPRSVGLKASRSRIMSLLRVPIWAFAGAASIALVALIIIAITFWRVPALAPGWLSHLIITVKTEFEGKPPSIAVLPFRGYGDESAKVFAAAISDGITTTLSHTSNMDVISRVSVEGIPPNLLPAQKIAQKLGVRYLLEGSVTKFGDSVVVRVGLIDTHEGEKIVPIGTYEKRVKDFFTLQGDITLNVVTSLRVRLTEGEQERISQQHGTKNFEAWRLATQGQKLLRKLTASENMRARRDYEAAIAEDPKYAGAWTGLAWTYLVAARFGWSKDRAGAIKKASQLANKSLALDDRRAATYALLGSIALFTGQYDVARRTGERSVELQYNDADAAALYALTLTYTGEPRKAFNLVQRAIRLRPYPPRWYNWLLARAYRLRGRPGKAVELLTAGNRETDKLIAPLVELATAYSAMGAKIQGRAVAEEIRRIYPGFSVKNWLIIPAYEDPEDTKRDLKLLLEVGLK
ncbi:MAG: BTAD domain-containing putative transcriptional regulator [Alphaproteobacteria bacterium]|nr:BTAD domain-containing putative transcriptional regulator [Alphaproteobacteria bacterium]